MAKPHRPAAAYKSDQLRWDCPVRYKDQVRSRQATVELAPRCKPVLANADEDDFPDGGASRCQSEMKLWVRMAYPRRFEWFQPLAAPSPPYPQIHPSCR